MAGDLNSGPTLKPIATRPRVPSSTEDTAPAALPTSPAADSTPRLGHLDLDDSPAGAAAGAAAWSSSSSSTPWGRLFTSTSHMMGFSPRRSVGDSSSGGSSNISTPVRRKKNHDNRDAQRGSILAYPSSSAAARARGTSAAGTGAFADEPLGKHGLALKQPLEASQEEYADTGEKARIPRSERPVAKHWNPVGIVICLFYIAAAVYYFVIRATRTLDMGYTGYGGLVLAIEVISSTATLGYAVLLIKHSRSRRTKGLPIGKKGALPPDPEHLRFHVRVLIPCYKESTDLVKETVLGALKAPLPKDTLRTVYLCDDGKDPTKAAMVRELKDEWDCLEYVSGRTRDPNGETNGKSNNLNHCLTKVIYKDYYPTNPQGPKIPKTEVMVVFDADMVARPNFFTKILEVMLDDDCALCLTPQGFNNVDAQCDIFNNLNLSFWEYMLPGTDALGYIACTGTNFCLRCYPLADCGWFPTFTITEDYCLGMLMKARGYKAGYLNEYLAIGEAPEDVRNVFRQRSRWCKGQMQVLFSKHCPLFDTGLTLGMRLLYTSVTWNYITNSLAVPCSVLVPFIALFFGIYPLVLNRDFALASTLYYAASTLVTMYCTDRKHLKPLWFCIVSCHLLWFTFTKALFNVLFKKMVGKVVVFKSTKKKGEDDGRGDGKRRWFAPPQNIGNMEGTLDAWVLLLSFCISALTAVIGVFQIIDQPYTAQGQFRFFLALSIFWALYNMIPPALFIFYCYNKGRLFEDFCSFCITASFLLGIGGTICTWLVPDDYNMGQVLSVSLQFFEAQRSGKLPRISNTPWRGDSGLWDSVLLPNGRNYSLIGGWYDDGGMLKLSYTTAFTVSMLSWAYYEFKVGYRAASSVEFGANTIRWGADYLLKAAALNITSGGAAVAPIFVAQVGDMTKDAAYWGSPERCMLARPATYLSSARPGTDVMAMSAAALAAAAVAIQDESMEVAGMYLNEAVGIYKLALQWPKGYYAKYVESGKRYPSVSMYDDLAYAAAWLYMATGQQSYLDNAVKFYSQHTSAESHVSANPYMFNYENVVPALDLLLYKATGDQTYKQHVQAFVKEWMNTRSASGDVYYTPRGLAKAEPDGLLQHTANAAFYTLLAAKDVLDQKKFMLYACWARGQIGYMVGDAGRSYVTGYGASQARKIPHKAASCPPADVADCTWESAYYTTDPNYHTLRGGLVGGPDDSDAWSDNRDVGNAANTVGLLNSAGFSAAVAGLVQFDINMAKCMQGNGLIQTLMLKATGQPPASGQRWWQGM